MSEQNNIPARPWRFEDVRVVDANGVVICFNSRGGTNPAWIEEGDDIMRHIVLCVNQHDKLVEAIQAAIDWRGLDGDGISDPVRQRLIAALAD